VTSDKLGDWRIESVSQLAQNYGSASAGSPIWLLSLAKHRKHGYLSFITPSAAALCLNIAIEAAKRSEAIKPSLSFCPMVTPDGKKGMQVTHDSVGNLYQFFEQSMTSVIMSFQAIEVFANSIIGRKAPNNILIKRKRGDKNVTPGEAERELSTEEKLGQVLPKILAVSSPRGNRAWQAFKMLKQARDATVHLKSHDVYTRNNIDRESLFFYYLNYDARQSPVAAIKVMSHFYPKVLPRWLSHAKDLVDHDFRSRGPTAF